MTCNFRVGQKGELTEKDFNEIELAASKAMREWGRGYVCQDIRLQHHISWWIMQETAKRVASVKDEEIKQLLDHLKAIVRWKDVIDVAAPDLGGFLSVLYRAEAAISKAEEVSQ